MTMQRDDLLRTLRECFTTMKPKPGALLVIGWVAGDNNLIDGLTELDFALHYASSVREALRSLHGGLQSDAILINGEALDAYSATEALRLYLSLPIVLLFTDAEKLSPMRAVEAGADEWLLTTVRIRELGARVNARIRRYYMSQRNNDAIEYYGAFALNPRTNELLSGSRTIRLTPAETHVLRCLASSPDRPVPVSELANALKVFVYDHAEPNYLLSVIQQLRTKLDGTRTNLLSYNDNAFLLSE